MPTLVNGKVRSNIIHDMPAYVDSVIEKGEGLIAGTRYHNVKKNTDTYTFYDMSNAYVTPDKRGDDLYMVNYHNGMSYSEYAPEDLLDGLIEYIYNAISIQSSSKATVRIVRNSQGRFELDNMRLYDSLADAKREGYKNLSEYAVSVSTGKHIPL